MNADYQRLLGDVMKLIAAQFGADCEVVLHDWSKKYDRTIVAIENGQVSGRKIGDGGSNLGLEVMRGTSDGSNQLNYLTQLPNGHMLRSSSLYLKDEKGEKIGALCINLDITDFMRMQSRIAEITMFRDGHVPELENEPKQATAPKEVLTTDVNELLEFLISEAVKQIGKEPADMSKDEKKQMLAYLDQKGALLVTKAGPRICRVMGISKYTLYNYLEEIHRKQQEEQGDAAEPEA